MAKDKLDLTIGYIESGWHRPVLLLLHDNLMLMSRPIFPNTADNSIQVA